jgi:hypothetical protein
MMAPRTFEVKKSSFYLNLFKIEKFNKLFFDDSDCQTAIDSDNLK